VCHQANSAATVEQRKYSHHTDEDEDEDEIEKTIWESSERFDALTIWEHHALPDEKQDHWIRGVQEWTAMAEAVDLHVGD
jgi:hypothetical protein